MSARLTALSHSTLTLVLECERLQKLSSKPLPGSSLTQLTRNLSTLRSGISDLEETGQGDAAGKLREQYERIWAIAKQWDGIESLRLDPPAQQLMPKSPPPVSISDPAVTPYRDEPSEEGPDATLHQQRLLMDEQDTHLDHLSNSIHRQRDISIQIGSELDVHTGLLDELDVELDRTESRLSGARQRLNRFSKGAMDNCSSLSIGLLIFVLLVLIIVFKT